MTWFFLSKACQREMVKLVQCCQFCWGGDQHAPSTLASNLGKHKHEFDSRLCCLPFAKSTCGHTQISLATGHIRRGSEFLLLVCWCCPRLSLQQREEWKEQICCSILTQQPGSCQIHTCLTGKHLQCCKKHQTATTSKDPQARMVLFEFSEGCEHARGQSKNH